MDVKDLRIGNYIESYIVFSCPVNGFSQPTIKVEQVDIKILTFLSEHPMATYRPIELSPSILEACGFEQPKNDESSCWIHKSNLHNYLHNAHATLRFAFIEGKLSVSIGDDSYGVIFARIQYLHELQNLWYSCNFNTELII